MDRPLRVAHVATVDLTHRFLLLNQLRHLRDRGYEVTAISAPGPYAGELAAEGIRHVQWPHITRSWDPAADRRAFAALVEILVEGAFDIVHTHNPKPGVMGRIAARRAKVPVVVNTVHGLFATPEDRLRKRLAVLGIERLAARFSDRELYQSSEDLAWARRIGVTSAARSALLGNGTDLEIFHPGVVDESRRARLRDELGIPHDAVVVGTVGRLVAEKGYHELFAASRRIASTHPEARFLIVGATDADKADAIEVPEDAAANLVFAGWRDDVRDLMAIMDVFVLASYREGLPRSAVEAAAMGKPLVLTDIRGCREVVRDGIEGELVPPRDEVALAGAIERMLSHADHRARCGAAARLRAEDRFDEKKVLTTIEETYEDLVAAKAIGGKSRDAGILIRRATPSDAAEIARLHRQGLPDAFLPTLGQRFLSKLYRALADDPGAVTVVAESEGRVVGFVSGVISARSSYKRFFYRHGISASLSVVPRLLRPATFRRAYETVRYLGGGRGDRIGMDYLPEAELLSIAVSPTCRSRGLGGELAEAMIAGLTEVGVSELKVVVSAANAGANRFYQRMGFVPATTFDLHEGTASNVWTYRCHSSLRSA
ncbi:MAG: GNAT family N-acetyltransferase [Actinomycetota bacterium]